MASAAADVYQLGLAVLRLLAKTRLKSANYMDLKPLVEYVDKHSVGQMWDLRQLLMSCTSEDPTDRPTAGQLLGEVRKRRAELTGAGNLEFEALAL